MVISCQFIVVNKDIEQTRYWTPANIYYSLAACSCLTVFTLYHWLFCILANNYSIRMSQCEPTLVEYLWLFRFTLCFKSSMWLLRDYEDAISEGKAFGFHKTKQPKRPLCSWHVATCHNEFAGCAKPAGATYKIVSQHSFKGLAAHSQQKTENLLLASLKEWLTNHVIHMYSLYHTMHLVSYKIWSRAWCATPCNQSKSSEHHWSAEPLAQARW